MNKEIKFIKRFFYFIIIGLTLLFGSSLVYDIQKEFDSVDELAIIEGKASYNKDLLYRRWAAMHGGVYAPITDTTPPNPYLSHIPDRDITTESGKKLTLINPAYMTRQVFEIGEKQYGIKGHITSLNPIRKENKPDDWEKKALQLFEKGESEYSSIEKIDGIKYMRFMHVMNVENSCLKCHAKQGYKVGDIRGGISCSVPMDKYNKIAFSHIFNQVSLYILLYIIIFFFTFFAYKLLLKEMIKRNTLRQTVMENEAYLKTQNNEYILLNEELTKEKEKAEKNEARLIDAQTVAKVGSWETNLTTMEVIWSDETYKIFELDKDSFKNSHPSFLNYVHKDDIERIEDVFAKSFSSKEYNSTKHRIITPSGKLKYVEERWHIIHDENEKPIKAFGTCQDITEKTLYELELSKAKEEIEKNEIRLRFAQKTSKAGTWDWDIVNNEFYWSEEFLEIFNLPKETIAGFETWKKVLHPDDIEIASLRIQESIENNTELFSDYRIVLPNQEIRWIRATGKASYENNKPLRMIGLCYDITLQKETEFELIKAKEKAEESDRLKSAFLQNMSHEIRTPLNAISGFSDLLNEQDISKEKLGRFVSIIQNSSQQLISIVTDILTISSLETNQEKLNLSKVCINNEIEELLLIFKQQALNHNISLQAKYELSDNQSEIYTDKTKIIQVITNLLTNALKFTNEGFVEFGYNVKDKELEFYVKDSGIGIDLEFHEYIFERFRQAGKSINKLYGGTGLGLAISKAFVELLGGKIWVESELEKGSTFYFTIPYNAVNEENITSNTNQKKQIKDSNTILVAEDEEFNFLFINELLKRMNLKVIHAKDGNEAIEIFKTNPDIDMILMDIKMPNMTGDVAAKIIKEINTEIPIVAQTAYALENEQAKYKEIFDDYITKPINKDILKYTIYKYIEY